MQQLRRHDHADQLHRQRQPPSAAACTATAAALSANAHTARIGTLTNCTVSGNSAQHGGGGLYNRRHGHADQLHRQRQHRQRQRRRPVQRRHDGTTTLTNCTVSGNSAGSNGGGLLNYGGTATLTNCTVSGNSAGDYGGGLYQLRRHDHADATRSSPGTRPAPAGPTSSAAFTSQGNNLIGKTDGSSGWVGSDLTGTIAAPLNPVLAPLGNYGGPTQTMALLPGSPAIDAGNNAPAFPAASPPTSAAQPHRRRHRRHRRLRVERVHHRRHLGKRPDSSVHVFAAPLVVTVTANNPIEPVAGGLVTFTPPASGASAASAGQPGGHQRQRHGERHGHDNGVAGSYTVSATASGLPARPRSA